MKERIGTWSRRQFLGTAGAAAMGSLAGSPLPAAGAPPAPRPDQASKSQSNTNEPAAGILRPSILRQPIYGFGGSQTFAGDALADYPGREAVYRALFEELKLDIFRLRNYYDYTGQEQRFEHITREFACAARRWGAASRRGGKDPVRLLFTSWSPPAHLKSNNDVRGLTPGPDGAPVPATLNRLPDGRYAYSGFADWWLASVEKFKSLCGAYPDYITLQNELDWGVPYEGCEFLPTEGIGRGGFEFAGYDRAVSAVSDRLRAALGARAPRILGPETFSIQLTTHLPGAPGPPDAPRVQLWADPTTSAGRAVLDRLFGISYHIYGSDAEAPEPGHQRFVASLQAVADAYRGVRKPMFQTEFLEGETLTQLAEMIHDTLVFGEASSYFVWISARTTRAPGYALVYYNPEDRSIERRERFYAMKHFSAFVGEGWNRIDATISDPSVLLSAFLNPTSGEMTAVLINPAAAERRVVLSAEGEAYRDAGTTVYRTVPGEGGERWHNLGPLVPGGVVPGSAVPGGVVTLPARSVATVSYVLPRRG